MSVVGVSSCEYFRVFIYFLFPPKCQKILKQIYVFKNKFSWRRVKQISNKKTTNKIKCFILGNIYFDSLYGNINVYGFEHPYHHMKNVLGSIYLTANYSGRNISFEQATTQVRELFAKAHGGFDIQQDLVSKDGEVSLTWIVGMFYFNLSKN